MQSPTNFDVKKRETSKEKDECYTSLAPKTYYVYSSNHAQKQPENKLKQTHKNKTYCNIVHKLQQL